MAQAQGSSPDHIDPHLLLTVLDAYRKGDFSQRLPADWTGLPGKVADTLNDMVGEFGRVALVASERTDVVRPPIDVLFELAAEERGADRQRRRAGAGRHCPCRR